MQAIEACSTRTRRRLLVLADRRRLDASLSWADVIGDLNTGDLEDTEWAGEVELPRRLDPESAELEHTYVQLP